MVNIIEEIVDLEQEKVEKKERKNEKDHAYYKDIVVILLLVQHQMYQKIQMIYLI